MGLEILVEFHGIRSLSFLVGWGRGERQLSNSWYLKSCSLDLAVKKILVSEKKFSTVILQTLKFTICHTFVYMPNQLSP